MNIEQAKAIPLAVILEKLGKQPTREKNNSAIYLSPIRNEKTASFHINHNKNAWYDFGIGKGGNTVDLVCAYLENSREASTVSDALRWLRNMTGSAPLIKQAPEFDKTKKDLNLVIKNTNTIQHPALIKYLERRGIPLVLASSYIVEVLLYNKETDKNFFALGFGNDEGGYEIRNQFFKGCVSKKAISFIRGSTPKPEGIHIFEGFMDYLSALLKHNKGNNFDDDAIILNSLSLLSTATPFIQGYGYSVAYSWMDNDAAGKKAAHVLDEFFKTEDQLIHQPMNHLYSDYKDVNEWHMQSP